MLSTSVSAAIKNYNVSGGQLKFDTATGTITGYIGSPSKVVISKTINGVKVKSIGPGAFSSCTSLTSVSIPDSVTSISDRAFWACGNLTEIKIPDSVKSIGDWVFTYCGKLEAIPIGLKNTAYSSLDGVLFNKAKTILKQYPSGKSGSYSIPNSVKSISTGAFYSCNNTTGINIPNGVAKIGNQAFCYCFYIKDIHLPDSVTSIGSGAFTGCDAEDITVGASNKAFTSVDGVLFNKAKTILVEYPGARGGSYVIPDSVTSIYNNAFADCYNMNSIYIPGTVKKIGDWAFIDCISMTRAYFYGDSPSMGMWVFEHTSDEFQVLHLSKKKGFTNPWYGYKTGIFKPELQPQAGNPDLVVTDVKWTPAEPLRGNEVVFSAVVKNQGAGEVNTNAISGVLFSVDGAPVSWSGANSTPIKPGTSVTLTASDGSNGKATWTATAGTHKVNAWVDNNNIVVETRERNNTLDKTLVIVPTASDLNGSSDTYNLRANANFEVQLAQGIDWVPANSLGVSTLNNPEVAELAEKSPEEKQEKVTNLYEALQLFQISNFKYSSDNVRIQEGCVNWEHHKPGYDAVRTNEGCCASDADWLNYILKNDYDELGFIGFSFANGNGHVFNYIKEGSFYYVIDLEQYESQDRYKHYTSPETGVLDDFKRNGSIQGNIIRVKSLTDYVTYYRKCTSNTPGLFVTYTADNVIPIDSVRSSNDTGITYNMAITYSKGSNVSILFDDPNDNMSMVYAEPPSKTYNWSSLPSAEVIPVPDF